MTKDVISLSISVLLLFRHYISHKITFGAPSSGGVLCSAFGAFISKSHPACHNYSGPRVGFPCPTTIHMKDTLNHCVRLSI